MKKIITLFIILTVFTVHAEPTKPRLIVQIVVDQLRGDLLKKHQSQFNKNGFNYLLKHSVDFTNAHHPHANTTTCAGHATIATGSYPALHGVVDNDWFDRSSGQLIYCMEDLNAKILPTNHTRKKTPGRSPNNLKASTLSDEIILANKGRAFAISFKDRAAITLAGHAGKAFWFDKTNGGFVTSSYYYSSYPHWIEEWNNHYSPKEYVWQLSYPISSYLNAHSPTFHHDYQMFGQSFPHQVKNPPSEDYFKFLSRSPISDELTANFAAQLLVREKLGSAENKTDYLGISFSAVDAIGHQFGPNSLEAEDNLIKLDYTLGKLLKVIEHEVGLNNTLIILTADHGVSDSPSFLKAHHIPEVNPVNIETTSEYIRSQLAKRYQLPAKALMKINPPFIYLDHQIIEEHHLNLSEVSFFISEQLTGQPGIFRAYPQPIAYLMEDWLSTKVKRMYFPSRSGDIYMVQPPYQSYGIHQEDRVSHGSPWQYDSYVPLLFVHPNFSHQAIFRAVATTDIAPTLSSVLMIKFPSATVGEPLPEVLTEIKKAFPTKIKVSN